MAESLIARELCYRSENRLLVDNVSVTLVPGELVALIGPNGAGKSTLLRLLSGWLQPDSGSCELAERALATWPRAGLARQRAVMRQLQQITFPLSVREIVALGRSPWPLHRREAIIDEVLALTDCCGLAARDFCQLSGGEQQRVHLARALVQLWREAGPHGWLFLDEPTSALDLYHQQQTLRTLRQLTRAGELSVCCVLHDLNLAALWADRIVLMHQGRAVASGTPQQVMNEATLTQWYQADLHIHMHPAEGVPQVALRR